jgi:hypothetical protein
VQRKTGGAVGVVVTATVDGLTDEMKGFLDGDRTAKYGLALGLTVKGLRAEGRLVEGLLEGLAVGVDG